MRATDIIRQVLNMIDSIEANSQQGAAKPELSVEIEAGSDEDLARMKQIAGLLSSGETQYSNQPQERIAGIEAVTTDAGGGINGPKDIADIKSSTVAMYPGAVFGAK